MSTHVSLTKPTQKSPTRAVTPPARSAAPKAWFGALRVCATKRYVVSAKGNVRVKGAIVRSVRGAMERMRVSSVHDNIKTTYVQS